MFAYERLAADLASQIRRGTLRTGDRIPSVRKMSHRRGLSVSTVLQAYRRLEAMRMIEARPQSGFFVLPQRRVPAPTPPPSSAVRSPRVVDTADLIGEIVRAVADPSAVPLGAALPDPALLPVSALNRTMATAMRSQRAHGDGSLRPEGSEALRREIAKREWNAGLAVHHDEILVTCGASEALYLALGVTTEPGDVVAVESPAFFGVLQAIEALGRRALEIPTCPTDGLDLEALERATRLHSVQACVATPSFQNPLGSCMPDPARARLVRLARDRGFALVEDDTFGELFFGEAQPRSLRAWDPTGSVLRCGSFGKTLAPGYRVGWIVPGERWIEKVRRGKLAATIGTSTPPQLAIARYMEDGRYDRHLRRLRRTLRDNVQRLSASVAEHFPAGTKITQPRGGFVLWVELPDGSDALDLYEQAREAGISTCPGPIFSPSGGFRTCLRLSAGHAWCERTENAVERMGRFAAASRAASTGEA